MGTLCVPSEFVERDLRLLMYKLLCSSHGSVCMLIHKHLTCLTLPEMSTVEAGEQARERRFWGMGLTYGRAACGVLVSCPRLTW